MEGHTVYSNPDTINLWVLWNETWSGVAAKINESQAYFSGMFNQEVTVTINQRWCFWNRVLIGTSAEHIIASKILPTQCYNEWCVQNRQYYSHFVDEETKLKDQVTSHQLKTEFRKCSELYDISFAMNLASEGNHLPREALSARVGSTLVQQHVSMPLHWKWWASGKAWLSLGLFAHHSLTPQRPEPKKDLSHQVSIHC